MKKFMLSLVGVVFAIQITVKYCASALELGFSCTEDNDCSVDNSRCYQKLCSCVPYYAAYNSTHCLQSNMLGFECIIAEQCSKKVANSTCIGGICRCEPGFLQFRRHTCLTAAKIGEVCYSDMHCRLWDSDSHCDFVIANLFGRCTCNAPLKQTRSGTCLPNVPPPATSTIQSLDFPYPVITKAEFERIPEYANKTIGQNKVASFSNSNNLKLQNNQQKVPAKTKPEHKPTNKTEKPEFFLNKVKPGQKQPDQRPIKPENKPPNKFNSKPSKPDHILVKPDKPLKRPDQKFQQLHQFLNKTQQKLEQLGDKIANFYQADSNTNIKLNKHSTSTPKPNRTSTEKSKSTTVSPKPQITSTKPNKQSLSNFFLGISPPKPIKQQLKNEIKTKQENKILVVNNQQKKPPKNKLSSANKTSAKNPFQTGFAFLGVKENNTSVEDSISRFPTVLNKQVEAALHEGNNYSLESTLANNSSAKTSFLLQRITEENSVSILSLGYRCKTDAQCMKNDNNSRCINSVCDCVARRTRLENTCSAKNRGCHKGTFQCKSNGICISWFFVCDGRKDCADGSDEDCKDKSTCPEHAFRCGSAVPAICISTANRCDGVADCPNGEDEYDCIVTKQKSCPSHTFQCEDGRCLPEYEFCNAVISCEDGSDEPDTSCTATWNTSVRSLGHCPFRCSNGRCRSSAVVCSGRDGCGDNSDENRCSICKCPPTISR